MLSTIFPDLAMELLKYKKSKEPPVAKPQKQLNLWLIGLAVVALGGGIGYWYVVRIDTTTVEPEPITNYVAVAVTALGRLEPAGEVIKLSVANAQDSRVNELLVEEGDRVEAGQLIATLQGLDQKQAELLAAKQNVAVYQAKLKQVRAGEAKSAEIEAQIANIARLQAQMRNESIEREAEIADAKAEFKNDEINYSRYQSLYQDGAVSKSDLDDRQELYQRSLKSMKQILAE